MASSRTLCNRELVPCGDTVTSFIMSMIVRHPQEQAAVGAAAAALIVSWGSD